MNIVRLVAITLLLAFELSCNSQISDNKSQSDIYQEVKNGFSSPDSNSGVNCWWWWLNGNVTKTSITKDLEAMKSKNFQGAMIFDAGGHNQRGNKDIPEGPLFGSDEWNELFVFALDEAKRLGLEIGFNIQSGWNLGGPRVTPQYAAKQLVYTETLVTGNKSISIQLDQPRSRYDFYEDIAVLAVPLQESNETSELISDLNLKLGFRELGGSAPDTRFLLRNSSERSTSRSDRKTYIIKKDAIVDLTSNMEKGGQLKWDVPAGNWSIIRIGYSPTSSHVSTSSGQWQGSVLDYMSTEAFDFYWNDVVIPIFEASGDHVGNTLKFMETDSWECGGMNWTANFSEEFSSYRGYDLKNYLPIVAGYIIEDVETSNAFLSDFRKTLGDLVAYNHYARFQEFAHKYNMGIQPESAGPHAGPMDGIKNYGFSDIVMSEFWSPSPHRPKPENRFFVKQASSAAHIYGKKIVGAESFTTIGPHWNDELWHDQKSSFDHEICAGLNRMYFHTFTASPPEMGLPGQEYFAGTHVNPQVTWWDQSGGFIDYMHRTQSVLQEGKFVADVLYYYGDHVPNVFPYQHADPAGAMPGFDYDVTDETILKQIVVENDRLLVPGGVSYRVLVLPDHEVVSLAVLKKVEKLLDAGATVIGRKPVSTISLVGGQVGMREFKEITDKIWGKANLDRGQKEYGQGQIVWGVTAREFLLAEKIPTDFNVVGNNSPTDYGYIHYKLDDKDVYFVSNQTDQRKVITAQFRVLNRQPELWDALTGEIRDAKAFSQENGVTNIPLTFDPYGSILVVFDREIGNDNKTEANRNYPDYKTIQSVDGAWEVNFDPTWGGPASVVFPELIDWTQHADERIKYYSGAATYHKTINIDALPTEGKSYFLQLGNVKDVGIAEVKINGVDKGVLWTKPFRVGIGSDLKVGENKLEIKVVNSWYNRVAGDEISADSKKYTQTNIVLSHDFRGRDIEVIPLEPSGLLGPVTIEEGVLFD